MKAGGTCCCIEVFCDPDALRLEQGLRCRPRLSEVRHWAELPQCLSRGIKDTKRALSVDGFEMTWSFYVAQNGLELTILLPLLPENWGSRGVTPYPAKVIDFEQGVG